MDYIFLPADRMETARHNEQTFCQAGIDGKMKSKRQLQTG